MYITKTVLILVIIPAVFYDLQNYRIPNRLIMLGYILGMVFRLREGLPGLASFAAGAMLPVISLILLQRAGILGGGDIKLLSVTGGFLGFQECLRCMVLSFLFAAALSLMLIVRRRNFKHRICYFLKFIQTVVHTGRWIPYYDIARDGYDGTIHFSAAVLLAVLLVLQK